jgi:hypothetical protein
MASEPLQKTRRKQPVAAAPLHPPEHGAKKIKPPKIEPRDCPADGSVPCGPPGKGDKGL